MGTIVTFSKDRRKPVHPAEMKDMQHRLNSTRLEIDRVKVFIDDPTRDEMMRQMPKLSPEQIEEQIKAGAGTYTHSTVIEPVDLELYRSYMYPPLSMPEKPEVMVTYVDGNNPIGHFMEGRVLVKAKCPDGIESWLVISIPVPNFYTCLEGNCWGWPKYVADEMTFTPTKAEVIYQGESRLSMEFTPGGVDEATEKELKERGGFEGGNTVSFHVYKGGGCLVRQAHRGAEGSKAVEWQAGMHKVYLRPVDQDPCAGLIPAYHR